MDRLEETSGICRVCLVGNVKMYGIENKKLQMLYEVLSRTKLDVGFGVYVKLCYMCYPQLKKILKFSKLAQDSIQRLRNLKYYNVPMFQGNSEYHFLGTQHNLTINIIPPICIIENSNIIESTYTTIKEEHIETEDSASNVDFETLEKDSMYNSTLINTPTSDISSTQCSLKQSSRKRLAGINGVSRNKPIDVKKRRTEDIETRLEIVSKVCQLSTKTPLKLNKSVNNDSEIIKKVDNLDLSSLSAVEKEPNPLSIDSERNDDATPFTNNKLNMEVFLEKVSNDQRKAIIEETINKLVEVSELEKTISLKNPRPQQLPWCIRSQTLLLMLINLSDSEQAGAMLLTDRVFPLFLEGFARVPSLQTLLEMAGYKNAELLQNDQQNDNNVIIAPHLTEEKNKNSNSLLKPTETSPAVNETAGSSPLRLPRIMNSFSLSNILIGKSKKNRNKNIPIHTGKKFNTCIEMKLAKPLIGSRSTVDQNEMINTTEAKVDNFIKKQSIASTTGQGKSKKIKPKLKTVRDNKNIREKTPKNSQLKRQKLTKIDVIESQAIMDEDMAKMKMNAMFNNFSKFKQKLDSHEFGQSIQYIEKELEIRKFKAEDSDSSDVEFIEN